MLASFTFGVQSKPLKPLSEQDIVDKTLQDVAQVHNQTVGYLKSILVQSVVKKWGDDPYARSAVMFGMPYHVKHHCLLNSEFNIILDCLVYTAS